MNGAGFCLMKGTTSNQPINFANLKPAHFRWCSRNGKEAVRGRDGNFIISPYRNNAGNQLFEYRIESRFCQFEERRLRKRPYRVANAIHGEINIKWLFS